VTADSVLSSLVEVAVGLAGFAGIITAIRQRNVATWSPTDRVLLQALFGASAAAIALAIAPGILQEANFPPSRIWRTGSAMLLVWFAVIPVIRERQMRMHGLSALSSTTGLFTFLWVVAVALLQIFNLVRPAPWPYLVGVAGLLATGFIFFFQLMFKAETEYSIPKDEEGRRGVDD